MLTVVGLTTIALNLLVSRIISHKRVNITRVQMRDSGKLAATTVSGIQMVETIKASGAENGFFQKWAGYLKETSRIDRVAVIRDVGKKRRILHVDLRSKDLFLSPAYYLQQNDIVYVEPNNLKATQRSRQTLSYVTTGFSLLSTATMLVLYLTK